MRLASVGAASVTNTVAAGSKLPELTIALPLLAKLQNIPRPDGSRNIFVAR